MQGCIGYLESLGSPAPSATEHLIHEYWGSVSRSMLSLFEATTGGEDWAVLADPLWAVGSWMYCLFVAYVAFFLFIITNTLTSIFVDSVSMNAQADDNMLIDMELEKKEQYISKLQSFFNEIDLDRDGFISYQEFIANGNRRLFQAFAATLDVEITDVNQCFRFLAGGGENLVDIESFVVGCIKMKGMARSMDLLSLAQSHRQAWREQKECAHSQARRLANMEMLLNKLSDVVWQRLQNSCSGVWAV